jgi:hypothetical protein
LIASVPAAGRALVDEDSVGLDSSMSVCVFGLPRKTEATVTCSSYDFVDTSDVSTGILVNNIVDTESDQIVAM